MTDREAQLQLQMIQQRIRVFPFANHEVKFLVDMIQAMIDTALDRPVDLGMGPQYRDPQVRFASDGTPLPSGAVEIAPGVVHHTSHAFGSQAMDGVVHHPPPLNPQGLIDVQGSRPKPVPGSMMAQAIGQQEQGQGQPLGQVVPGTGKKRKRKRNRNRGLNHSTPSGRLNSPESGPVQEPVRQWQGGNGTQVIQDLPPQKG